MGSTRRLAAGLAAAALLASCGPRGFDPDLRGWLPGNLATADAAAAAPARPQPDERGVISFPGSQVVLARSGDTPAAVAARLGLSADALARHNALPADAALTAGAVLVLPQRVAAGAPAAAAAPAVRDPFAAAGPAAAGGGATPRPAPANPREHVVTAGETAWSVARRYNITVQDLAAWNGLPADMSLRVGQRLIVPAAAARAADATTSAPGQGSATPLPPSAAAPLPDETTRPAAAPAPEAPVADLGTTRTAASGSGRFRMPVQGSIIRVYEKGRNDGIDIAAPAGSTVAAAGAGTVAAVTRDTSGVPIVVVRHEGDLMTVYAGLGDVAVAKGDAIGTGERIGAAGSNGFVHFEVRRGFESLDPETFLN